MWLCQVQEANVGETLKGNCSAETLQELSNTVSWDHQYLRVPLFRDVAQD